MRLLTRIVTIVFFKLFYRVEIVNKETIPEKGPIILCANHNTMLDMFFIGYRLKRWIFWMAKEELFKNPVSGLIFRSLGAFPVKRGKGDVGSIKTALKIMERGDIVGIFPYGTRRKVVNGRSARVKPGAAMLAVNSGTRIVPAAVIGTYKLFSRMKVVFGEPFEVGDGTGRKYLGDELTVISEEIMRRVNSLLEA